MAKKNIDIAIDVCAMTPDGGVVLYGLGEEENGGLTQPTPIELAGQAECIDQIAQASISEPPYIEIVSLPTTGDPAIGYLAVVVPRSARAPHQVTVRSQPTTQCGIARPTTTGRACTRD